MNNNKALNVTLPLGKYLEMDIVYSEDIITYRLKKNNWIYEMCSTDWKGNVREYWYFNSSIREFNKIIDRYLKEEK